MTQPQLISLMRDYFKEKVILKHQTNIVKVHSKLKNYQINPIVVKYLSQLIENKVTEEGIAKALFYPRVLGTSITGSFGSNFQRMLIDLGLVSGSLIPGMDIEYDDRIDGRHKYCQLKSGPNTINSKDVSPILAEFDSVANLARTNNFGNFSNNDLVLGLLYGDKSQLSGHYQKIDARYPVYIGTDFWHRITGFPDFYNELIKEINKLIATLTESDIFIKSYENLLDEIKAARII